MKKNNIIKISIAVMVLVAICGGYYYKAVSTAKAKSAVKYTTVKAAQGTVSVTIQATGAASAATSDDIVSSNNGIISNVNVKIGDSVKAGQTIGFINDTTLQQSVSLAQLKVNQDITNNATSKTTLQQSVSLAQLKVNQDNANIASNKDAQKVDSNATQLLQDQSDLSDKTTKLDEIGDSSNNIQLLQDQTDLNTKTAQLAKETVKSPITGVIVTLNLASGDTAQSGKTIATVVDMNSLQIIAQVDELDIAKVANGQKATITFDALTGKTYTGTVSKVSQLGTTTSDVTNYPVYIKIDNPSGIKIGMNSNINITVASKSNVVTLSLDAISTINGKKYVLTSIPQTTSKKVTGSSSNMKEVTTGITNQSDVEIVSGVKEGESVYIKMPTVSTSTTSTSKTSTSTTAATGTSNFGGGTGGSMPSGGGGN